MKNHLNTRLKDDVLNKIKASPLLQAKLADHFKVSLSTITRWAKAKPTHHHYLSFMESLIIISQELNTQPTELTVQVEKEMEVNNA